MKKYLAIGHFKDNKEFTTSVSMKATTKKNFQSNLRGNEFVAYVIISEKKLETLKTLETLDPYGFGMEIYEEVKKMTTNYRKWNEVTEYIEQCLDIMEEKMQNA